jgi:hypothetical protein
MAKGGNGDQDKGRADDHYKDLRNEQRWTQLAKETAQQHQEQQGNTDNGGDDS